jgi:hypothetical protein
MNAMRRVHPAHLQTSLGHKNGWRGRIRTFNPLIQSQVPYRLATRQRGHQDTKSRRAALVTLWLFRGGLCVLWRVSSVAVRDLVSPGRHGSAAGLMSESALEWTVR